MAPPAPAQPATGIKQTIQARHGVATYVPQGYTIKIINTYGKQVVDTWAFALHAPPEDSDIQKGGEKDEGGKDESEQPAAANLEETVKNAVENSSKAVMKKGKDPEIDETPEETKAEEPSDVKPDANETVQGGKETAEETVAQTKEKAEDAADAAKEGARKAAGETEEKASEATEKSQEAAGKAEQKTEETAEKAEGKTEEKTGENAPKKSRWSAYIPTLQRNKSQAKKKEKPATETEKAADENMSKSWSSYLGVGGGGQKDGSSTNTNSQKKGWSAYIPSGQGFSSYMPSKDALSAFAGSHYRDPTKSYAEQLLDFSKTPVGAAGLSAATGSGYAGSLYAAYKAYEQVAGDASVPAMEYMSMMHTRASTLHLSPRVGDTLTSNLRAPLLTVVEDTSPGVHDTLIAACDPQRYKELGVEKWEEHGSCSENCVLALKEINERSGLKGKRAIGSDVTVNTVPAPLNLFMNIPWTKEGDVSFDPPKTKRGDYVKFRAERDVVVVMSACPQDVLAINGHKPMVAHFVVESSSAEDMAEAKKKGDEAESILAKARRRMSSRDRVPKAKKPEEAEAEGSDPAPVKPDLDPPKAVSSPRPGRKAPRKLEKRGSVAHSPGPSSKA